MIIMLMKISMGKVLSLKSTLIFFGIIMKSMKAHLQYSLTIVQNQSIAMFRMALLLPTSLKMNTMIGNISKSLKLTNLFQGKKQSQKHNFNY